MKGIAVSFLFLFLLWGCTPTVEKINYGQDPCAFCKMVITDVRYGSEVLTPKGKCYKFDSVECLIDYLKEKQEKPHSIWVTSFTRPATLVNADSCYILKSQEMPSPMGRYLTAFSNPDSVKVYHTVKGGSFLPWEEAQKVY